MLRILVKRKEEKKYSLCKTNMKILMLGDLAEERDEESILFIK
jgi:hypothetical protein